MKKWTWPSSIAASDSADLVQTWPCDEKEQDRTDYGEEEDNQDPYRLILLGRRPNLRVRLQRVEECPYGGDEDHDDQEQLAASQAHEGGD